MSLPGIQVNLLDNGLGITPSANTQLLLYLGVCTSGVPATLAAYTNAITGLQANLGLGKLVEAAALALDEAGGPVLVMPVYPSNPGSLGAVTHTGTGAASLTVSAAPPAQIAVACTTGGTLATAAFTFQNGTGPVSSPVVSASAWSSTGYLVPGTFTVLTFAAGTYASTATQDTYTISTLGVVTHVTGSGPSVTQASSPIDDYFVDVSVVTAGAQGTAVIATSLDNGCPQLNGAGVTSANILTNGGGTYAIPNSGIVLTFSGTMVKGDTYTFQSCGPAGSESDYTAAYTALETTYRALATQSIIVRVGTVVSAAAWKTAAADAETMALTFAAANKFSRVLTEVPTIGSVVTTTGSLIVDSADTDTVVVTARGTTAAPHVVGCAGDALVTSPLTGLTLRRNALWPAAARTAATVASQNIGALEDGGLTGVEYLFRDENATPAFDAAGLLSLCNDSPGPVVCDAHTCSLSTSDYYDFANARVIDEACTIVVVEAAPLVKAKVPTTTRGNLVGVITNRKANSIEGRINTALEARMVNTNPADAVATSVTVDRTHDILADSTIPLTVDVQPFGYGKHVIVNIGLVVNA